MTINERFFSLLDEKGVTQKDFCQATQIPKQTVSGWKNRKTDPPASLIITIANYFGVTAAYMLTGEEPKYQTNGNVEDFSTKQLLAYYNSLSEIEKSIILGKTAELYLNNLENSKKSSIKDK